jgi:predicted transcriptional regulator
MQAKSPQVLSKASELLTQGVIRSLDVAILNGLFWDSNPDGSVRRRVSLSTLSSQYQVSRWSVRAALRRLKENGLITVLRRSVLAGKGTAYHFPGKQVFQSMQKARRSRNRDRARRQKMAGRRRYSRLPSQTVRKATEASFVDGWFRTGQDFLVPFPRFI